MLNNNSMALTLPRNTSTGACTSPAYTASSAPSFRSDCAPKACSVPPAVVPTQLDRRSSSRLMPPSLSSMRMAINKLDSRTSACPASRSVGRAL